MSHTGDPLIRRIAVLNPKPTSSRRSSAAKRAVVLAVTSPQSLQRACSLSKYWSTIPSHSSHRGPW
eukprot:4320169-Prymnesium_polylepis.3